MATSSWSTAALRDRTAERAARAGARVVVEPRPGYGRACLTGAAASQDCDVLLFVDGDGSDAVEQAERLILPIAAGEADLVLGSRTRGHLEPGALGMHQRVGNRLVATILNRRHGLSLTDIGPFRAIRRDVFDAAGLHEMTYGLPTEMIRNVARRGYRIRRGAGRLPAARRRRVEGFGQSARLAAGRVAHGADRDAMSEPRVLVTAKAPRPGWVKTRLCPPFGLATAARIAGALLDDSLRAARTADPGAGLLAPAGDAEELRRLYPDTTVVVQHGNDLAAALLGASSAGMTLVSGDAPDYPPELITRALESTADVVLGPSHDGGYCLLRTRMPAPELFTGISWSTGDVLDQTIAAARRLGRTLELLDAHPDVDTVADLRAVDLTRAPATAAAPAGPGAGPRALRGATGARPQRRPRVALAAAGQRPAGHR